MKHHQIREKRLITKEYEDLLRMRRLNNNNGMVDDSYGFLTGHATSRSVDNHTNMMNPQSNQHPKDINTITK